ncbi:uncharacterized protein LOC125188513 [Salvia hispanica]|uniref:uncharacterized protein LOC125188513 n=1 Tax=Salvia hispanica TaxID=49212 RepID=UPI0020093D43|nr:uncharacterized protein LOC125188513 [Salvia hispanica]
MSSGGGSDGGSGGDAEEFERRFNEELDAHMSRGVNRLIQRALQPQQPVVPQPIVHRRAVVDRDHVAAHISGYLKTTSRQSRERRYLCFRFRYDAAGRPGRTAIQKCAAAIRQLAYGGTTNMWDEYLYIGKTTALDCLKYFCQGVVEIFGEQYLRSPTPEDCQDLMQMHGEQHGFLGMLSSIDCMHWEWKNCPAAWKGFYMTNYKGKNPTMILEAVANYRLWI